MSRLFYISFLVTLCIFCSSTHVLASGIGLYGTFGSGSQEWDGVRAPDSLYKRFDTDVGRKGIGLSFDSRLAGDGIFNYHTSLGYESIKLKDFLIVPYNALGMILTPIQTDLTMNAVVWSHAFGFGAPLSNNTRLWFGPELRLEYAKGTTAPNIEVEMYGLGIGPTIGFNVNFSNRFSMVIKTGYQFMAHNTDVTGNIGANSSVSRKYDIDETFYYVNLELFVRTRGDK